MEQEHFFSSGDIAIRYLDARSGAPVAAVRGLIGTAENWSETHKPERFRILNLGYRSYGRSGKPHDPDAYVTATVDDIVGQQDHLGRPAVDFVGYS
jgi:pimeloyl-ACP methyl ester carboxylesterase